MAKKEKQLSYLQVAMPEGQKQSRVQKVDWLGLDKRQTMDTGALTYEKNISSDCYPYLIPSPKRALIKRYSNPIGLFGFDDFLLVVYRDGTKVRLDYITKDNTYSGDLQSEASAAEDSIQRSIVKYNVFDNPQNPVEGGYREKLLIFPDKKTIDFKITADFMPMYISSIPNINYAAVHLSRVFGVDANKVYCSRFNDYASWDLDTATEFNESNGWMSPTQSNTKANGNFTGIAVFSNHVICFKRDFMHEIYNNKNPFRIQDIFAEGTIDNRSIADVDGNLLFVSRDNVKAYTGGNPQIISDSLKLGTITYAVAGTDNRRYYLYCSTLEEEHNFFVFDSYYGIWTEEAIGEAVVGFAHNFNGMYALTKSGLYQLDTNDYTGQEWAFETDFTTGRTSDIKHIQKIQVMAEMEKRSNVRIYGLYDGAEMKENAELLYDSGTRTQKKLVNIRVIPRQTANYGFKLRFEGSGYVKFYQMELNLKQGGEMNVSR